MLIAVLCTTSAMAQGKFDPKRFITELHQYVMREAGLEAQARGLITNADPLELHLKETEKAYHARMLHVISAIKLSQVLKAERRFHRLTFRRMAGKDQ